MASARETSIVYRDHAATLDETSTWLVIDETDPETGETSRFGIEALWRPRDRYGWSCVKLISWSEGPSDRAVPDKIVALFDTVPVDGEYDQNWRESVMAQRAATVALADAVPGKSYTAPAMFGPSTVFTISASKHSRSGRHLATMHRGGESRLVHFSDKQAKFVRLVPVAGE